jgi:spore germination protein YaaH
MRLRRAFFGLLLSLPFFCQTALSDAPRALAYMGWWLPDSWRAAPLGALDRVLFFEVKVDASGAIKDRHGWPDQWTELQAALEKHQTPLDLTITLLDPVTFNSVFSSEDAIQRLLNDAVNLGSGRGVSGIQLDIEIYELINPDQILRYRRFVADLSKRLRALSPARSLSVFFPMGAVSQIYDAATLAQIDWLVLQGYDSHWAGSKNAGPIASLQGPEAVTWEKGVTQVSALGMARENMVISFPLYGYEWPVKGSKPRSATTGKGVNTTFASLPRGLMAQYNPVSVQDQVQNYGSTYDATSGSSYYHYKQKNGQWVEGWYEDWWSLDRKSRYLTSEQLGGIAFFIIGYDGGQLVQHFLRSRGPRGTPRPLGTP